METCSNFNLEPKTFENSDNALSCDVSVTTVHVASDHKTIISVRQGEEEAGGGRGRRRQRRRWVDWVERTGMW